MANTPISSLTSGAPVLDSDLLPDVQFPGVGPVKVTASQLKSYIGNGLTLINPILNNPVTINGVSLTFPSTSGTSGYILSTNGAGVLSWIPQGVTSVNISGGLTGLNFTNGPVTSIGTFVMNGTLSVFHGGTGATTRQGALLNLLPLSTPTTAGYALFNDGAGNFYWAAAGGGGGGGSTVITVGSTPVVGGSNGSMVFDSAGFFGEANAITCNGTSIITLGNGIIPGGLTIGNSAAGSVTLQAGAGATTWTMSLPPNAGSLNQVLTTSGTGVTSWTTIPTTSLTVDTTSITGGSNGRMVYDNGGTFGEALNIITDGDASLVLGDTAGGTVGNLGLVNATSKIAVLASSPSMGTTYSLTLPPDGGTNGQFLSTDGSGVTTWQTVSADIVVGTTIISGGLPGSIPFNNGAVYTENNANLFWDNTNFRLGIGTNSPSNVLTVVGSDALINGLTVGLGLGQVATNTVIGSGSLASNTTGISLTAVGNNALAANTTGQYNTAIGESALLLNTLGDGNVAIGANALDGNTAGKFNLACGTASLHTNSISDNNTAVGIIALYNSTGSNNTAIGYSSGQGISSGSYNSIVGSYTGAAAPISGVGDNYIVLSDGQGNIGAHWLGTTGAMVNTGSITAPSVIFPTSTPANTVTITSSNSTTAAYTLTLPISAGSSGQVLSTDGAGILSWSDNLADPFTAGSVPFAGSAGVLIEDNAKFFWDDVNYRLGIGTNAPNAALTVSGKDADINGLTIGKGNNNILTNTALGVNALANAGVQTDNTAVGINTLQFTTAQRNTAVGSNALSANLGGLNNAGIGVQALYSNQTGNNNTAIGTFAVATAVGNSSNTGVGAGALNQISGSQNTAIGANSGDSIPSGDNNTIVGRYRGTTAPFNGAGGNGYIILSDGNSNVRFCTNSSGALSFDGTNYGNSGEVLQSNGNAAAPTWVNPNKQINYFIQMAGAFFYLNINDMLIAQGITDAVGNIYVVQNALGFDASQNCVDVPNTGSFSAISTATSINFVDTKTTTIMTTSLAGTHSYVILSSS